MQPGCICILNHRRPILQRPAELTMHPPLTGRGERWPLSNRTRLQRPAGTFRVLAFCMQYGAGLYVAGGTATLTNTNVYQNNAARVHLHFESS